MARMVHVAGIVAAQDHHPTALPQLGVAVSPQQQAQGFRQRRQGGGIEFPVHRGVELPDALPLPDRLVAEATQSMDRAGAHACSYQQHGVHREAALTPPSYRGGWRFPA